ncbi:polyketide cyclase [Pseudomonas brassicacearum]|uniref:nuclear transport factor 2 family protein n=1 Tax=Pseudomonas brassicacearum TaxID=930166 RepID=UPI00042E16BB|nr:nuclear transport factor 2 family protein [Pseudomonas brassicacearum]AHL34319.1 polyketide cyclase [Pseudomonas brassicacearum]
MTFRLPSVVEQYFDITNGDDASSLATCFSADATVLDENRTHTGIDAIEAWRRETQQAFAFQVEPIEVIQGSGTLNVTARVTGDFPGSSVQLNHLFTLADGRIRALEITP